MDNLVNDYYREGIFTATISATNIFSLAIPGYDLLPLTGYGNGTMELVLTSITNQSGTINRAKQSLATNREVIFSFHLILPMNNS